MNRRRRVPREIFLGVVPGTRRGVGVSLDARVRGTYVVGVTGSGKSTFLLGNIVQDLRAGRGLCLLDPNGDLVDDVIARASGFRREGDVLLLDLQAPDVAFGLNLFACAAPEDPQAVAQTSERVVAAFKKVWGGESWGPRMQDLLANAALTLVANPGTTLADLPRLLTDAQYRQCLTRRVVNPVVREFWQREYDPISGAARHQIYAPLTNKVREFLRNPLLYAIVSQPENSVDLPAAIAGRKVVLVRFDPAMEEATNLLGTVVVQHLLEAAFARKDRPLAQRHPFMVYADEAHRFATPSFVTLLREARKYGIATTVATQMHSLLPADVATAFTNSATVVCFQLVPEDARVLRALFDGSAVPRRLVPDPEPLGALLRAGHPDPSLVAAAQAVVRELARYQASLSPGATHGREVRLLVDAALFAAMTGGDDEAWAELRAASGGAPGLLAAVGQLARRLAVDPIPVDRGDRVDVAAALVRLPAYHALVRYRAGTRVAEALVRTLPTRPLGRPVAIRPLGVPRSRLSPLPPADEPAVVAGEPALAAMEPAGDDPPPMFAPR